MEVVEIYLNDLEEVRQVLAACQNYFLGRDLMEAQVEFRASRPSPLSAEISRLIERFNGYMGDYLLAQHEASLEEAEEDNESEDEGEGEGEEDEEALSTSPLGEFVPPRQASRRLTKDELE